VSAPYFIYVGLTESSSETWLLTRFIVTKPNIFLETGIFSLSLIMILSLISVIIYCFHFKPRSIAKTAFARWTFHHT